MKRLAFGAALALAIALILRRITRKDYLPLLNAEQRAYAEKLHPAHRQTFARFIVEAEKTGWSVIMTSGYRDFATQKRLKAENSKNASPGRSFHNYGLAIDINLQKDGKRIRMASPKSEWNATGVPDIAKKMGLKWGGDFPNYHDPVHFDVSEILKKETGLTMNDLYAKAVQQFGDITKARGNELKF